MLPEGLLTFSPGQERGQKQGKQRLRHPQQHGELLAVSDASSGLQGEPC